MKSIKTIFTIVILLISTSVFTQNKILSIQENNNGEIESISSNIVDINSTLEVSISKQQLIKQIKNEFPAYSEQLDIQSKIERLKNSLKNQKLIFNYLDKSTKTALSKSEKTDFYKKLLEFYTFLLSDDDLKASGDQYLQEFFSNKALKRESIKRGEKERYVINSFANNLKEAKNSLANYEEYRFNISMLAYIKNKAGIDRVHIQNFDTYSERDYYTVERWVTSLSDEQKEELKDLKEQADEYNSQAPNYFENFKTEVLRSFPEFDVDLTCISSLESDVKTFITNNGKTITAEVQNKINELIKKYDDIKQLIDLISTDISSWSINTPFDIAGHIQRLDINLKDIDTAIDEVLNTIIQDLKISIDSLKTSVENCYGKLSNQVMSIKTALGLLNGQQDRFSDNQEIGKEVLSFGIDNLPSTGYIDLKGSGKRENGDVIEVSIIIRNAPIPSSNSTQTKGSIKTENRTLEYHNLTMQLIGLRSETSVGIILADPYNEKGFTPPADRKFLYAPSAALLFKVGSRKSNIYNKFLDFGFGISVSTPDFNTDGTPEFGTGLMFTAFKNILNVGINYNVTLDTPYWSFGLNLPFNLPGVPINQPK